MVSQSRVLHVLLDVSMHHSVCVIPDSLSSYFHHFAVIKSPAQEILTASSSCFLISCDLSQSLSEIMLQIPCKSEEKMLSCFTGSGGVKSMLISSDMARVESPALLIAFTVK